MQLSTRSAKETEALGARLATLLRAGDVLTLEAPLGAGKTTLTRGLAEGLGVPEDEISSPTFVIWQIYQGRTLRVSHFDCYRLSGGDELDELGFSEVLSGGDVVIIEWPAVALPLLPPDRLEVTLDYGLGPDDRVLRLQPHGAWTARLADEVWA